MKKEVKIALIVMIIALVAYICLEVASGQGGKVASSKVAILSETGIFFDYDLDSRSSFHVYGKGFFHVSKDGVSYISSDGQEKFNYSVNLTSPFVVADKGIIAVSEVNGRNMYVFDPNGIKYSKQTENPILSVSVNATGYSCVITKISTGYGLDVYSDNGNGVSGGKLQNENVFVVTTDISDDNRILAISYFDINDVEAKSEVSFHHIEPKEYINYLDGNFSSKYFYEGQLVGIIEFCDNNDIYMVSDSKIFCSNIDTSNKYNDKWEKVLTNEVTALAFNDGKGLVVAYGKAFLNNESLDENTIEMYGSSSPEPLSTYKAKRHVTYVSASMDSYIVGMDRSFIAVNKRGSVLWSYNATQDVNQMLFADNTSTALYVTNNKTKLMKLTKGDIALDQAMEDEQ